MLHCALNDHTLYSTLRLSFFPTSRLPRLEVSAGIAANTLVVEHLYNN